MEKKKIIIFFLVRKQKQNQESASWVWMQKAKGLRILHKIKAGHAEWQEADGDAVQVVIVSDIKNTLSSLLKVYQAEV